ncbi:hypothetical protein KY363_00935, partial [Candidatus Woesearchaeota archaeon]|nr:hypothetical protein [Candidatus Woesearchaeota archaeon]
MSNIRNYVFAGLSLFLATGWEGAGYQEKVYEMKCDRLGCFERKYKDGVLVEEDYHKAPAEGGPFETSERTIVRMHQDPNVADP